MENFIQISITIPRVDKLSAGQVPSNNKATIATPSLNSGKLKSLLKFIK